MGWQRGFFVDDGTFVASSPPLDPKVNVLSHFYVRFRSFLRAIQPLALLDFRRLAW